jgi:hypothetical protein
MLLILSRHNRAEKHIFDSALLILDPKTLSAAELLDKLCTSLSPERLASSGEKKENFSIPDILNISE